MRIFTDPDTNDDICMVYLFEKVAYARGAQPADHFDKLGPVHGQEGNVRLVRHRLRQHRLAAPGRSQHQHPL
jgi:hypothetical protein